MSNQSCPFWAYRQCRYTIENYPKVSLNIIIEVYGVGLEKDLERDGEKEGDDC